VKCFLGFLIVATSKYSSGLTIFAGLVALEVFAVDE
jgi:hypothetical protein